MAVAPGGEAEEPAGRRCGRQTAAPPNPRGTSRQSLTSWKTRLSSTRSGARLHREMPQPHLLVTRPYRLQGPSNWLISTHGLPYYPIMMPSGHQVGTPQSRAKRMSY